MNFLSGSVSKIIEEQKKKDIFFIASLIWFDFDDF